MNEHTFTAAFRKKLPADIYWWKINDNFAGGVPDAFLEGTNRDLWIEFKYIKALPKRPDTLIDLTNQKYLSKLQQKWLKRREAKRGDTLVCVGCPQGVALFWENSWDTPMPAKAFHAMCHPNIENSIIDIAHFCNKIPTLVTKN
tara:strand:- start:6107 stop:6538 length:432 start_codon:yes stop_codon:yes gene_type:complete